VTIHDAFPYLVAAAPFVIALLALVSEPAAKRPSRFLHRSMTDDDISRWTRMMHGTITSRVGFQALGPRPFSTCAGSGTAPIS